MDKNRRISGVLRTFQKEGNGGVTRKSAACAALRQGLVLARFAEHHVRVTLLRQVQVDHCRGDVGQVIAAIQRQLNFIFRLNSSNFFTSVDSTQRAVATLTDS